MGAITGMISDFMIGVQHFGIDLLRLADKAQIDGTRLAGLGIGLVMRQLCARSPDCRPCRTGRRRGRRRH